MLILGACAASEDETAANETSIDSEYPNGDLLVDTEWLEEHLDRDDLRIVDLRRENYEGGHIPGAVQLDSGDLNDPNHEVDGMLVGEEDFEALIQSLGIDNSTTVVVYDDRGSLSAARLFYALEYYGHENVHILNGGYNAWLTEGRELSTEPPQVEAGDFSASANADLVADKDYVEAATERDDAVILDTRSAEEYTGEDVRAERGGCIASAVHLEWTESVGDDEVQYFKPYDELVEQFAAIGVEVESDQEIIPYCQTNVRGAHTYFTLRLLGFDHIRPYEGSWAEWGNDADTPIDTQ